MTQRNPDEEIIYWRNRAMRAEVELRALTQSLLSEEVKGDTIWAKLMKLLRGKRDEEANGS